LLFLRLKKANRPWQLRPFLDVLLADVFCRQQPTVVVERMGLRSKHRPQVVNVGALLPIHSGPGSLVVPLLLLVAALLEGALLHVRVVADVILLLLEAFVMVLMIRLEDRELVQTGDTIPNILGHGDSFRHKHLNKRRRALLLWSASVIVINP
jgi:hypothetical protein